VKWLYTDFFYRLYFLAELLPATKTRQTTPSTTTTACSLP
jgi:hypothetical protein